MIKITRHIGPSSLQIRQHNRVDPDSAVVTVQPFLERWEGQSPPAARVQTHSASSSHPAGFDSRRLDGAGLDDEGNVIVGVEVSRRSTESYTRIPSEYDMHAACGPAEAIWVIMNRSAAYKSVETPYNPTSGEPRIGKRYSHQTPPQRCNLDAPGLSAIYPVVHVRDALLEGDQ